MTVFLGVQEEHLQKPADWTDVTYGDGKFVAIASDSSSGAMYSTDGTSWSSCSVPQSTNQWNSVAYNGSNQWVAVASNEGTSVNCAMYSSDGVNWPASANGLVSSGIGGNWRRVDYGTPSTGSNSGTPMYMACSSATSPSSQIMYSLDGITWVALNVGNSSGIIENAAISVAFGDGKFVVLGTSTATALYSTDGTNWTQSTLPAALGWKDITRGGSNFVAVASHGSAEGIQIAYSSDGITWTGVASPELSALELSSLWRRPICITLGFYGTNRVMYSYGYVIMH